MPDQDRVRYCSLTARHISIRTVRWEAQRSGGPFPWGGRGRHTQDTHTQTQAVFSWRSRPGGTGWVRSQAEEEHTVDALVLCGDEGRGELRKALGSRKQAEIQGCPNGGTRLPSWAGMHV